MQKSTKQLLFFFLLALALFFLMGILFTSNALAQGLKNDFDDDWEWEDDWEDDWNGQGRVAFDARYNRVEAPYIGLRLKRDVWYKYHPYQPFLYGLAGYAFAAKEFEYQAGLEKGFFEEYRLALGAEYHRIIDTPDRWIISDLENSLAALLIREDFHDYFMNEGFSAYISQNVTRAFKVMVSYYSETHDSLEKCANWSVFGGDKRFPENPPMDEGLIRSLSGSLVLDTRNSRRNTTRGWYIQAELEFAGNDIGGDFGYERMLVDIRRYQKIWLGESVNIRLRLGSASGDVPWQRSFHLGGVSTLTGYRFKELPDGRFNPGGNRMFLSQIEYRFGGNDFAGSVDLGFLEHFNLILFFEAGWVQNVDADWGVLKGFGEMNWADIKSDLGVALANRSGSVRVQVAKRLDTGYKPYAFSFRISRPF